MKIFRVRGLHDYYQHIEKNSKSHILIREFESSIIKDKDIREFAIRGISYPVNQYVDFKVDYLYSNGQDINWRERLVCPLTNLNNRHRSSVHIIDIEFSPYPEDLIYMTEQVTPLFSFLKNNFKNLIGSEYLANNLESGTIRDNIRHEDMTQLSFKDESINYYFSFECFEHIPNYKKAISETHRVIKPGGAFLGTFSFDSKSYDNLIKAKLNGQGQIIYLEEPEYHRDPISGKGILCFTVFGWEVLDDFKRAGFNDVYVILFWSDTFGYLGSEQLFFVARK